jgi:DNA polymerase
VPAPAPDLEELREIAFALRAHVEWQKELGAVGIPASPPGAQRRAASETPADARISLADPRTASAAPPPSLSAQAEKPDAEKRRLRLAELAQEIHGCQKCVLGRTRTQTVFARGSSDAELCFIGEGPGADEDAQGFPFVGKAGQLLDRMIAAMGYGRDEVYVCNIVKCRPPENRKPAPEEMVACMPYLNEQLSLVSPRVIVALGATAVEGLLGVSGGITRMRGQWKLYRGSIPVMPTFHPAYLLRNPAAKREVWDDLKAVLKQLGRPVPAAGR